MLQWADTFNRYGTSTAFMLNGLYAQADSVTLQTDPDPTATGKVIRYDWSSVTASVLRYVIGSNKTTFGWAKRMWFAALPDAEPVQIMSFNDGSNVCNVALHVTSTGAILVTAGALSTSTALGTSSVAIVANAWNFIETKILFNTSTGTVEIRINGTTTVLSLTGKNTAPTGNAFCAQISCTGLRTVSTRQWNSVCYDKDWALWDTSGTYNNDFLGSVQISDRDTVSDVALTWTPSTGSVGWSILDNNPPLDDSAYIAAATVLSNTFGLQDLPADATSVKGLVLVNRSRKIDGGDGNVQMGIISGASTGLGTDRPITTAYTYYKDVIEVDPATGVPFTPAAFNASNLKQSRTV